MVLKYLVTLFVWLRWYLVGIIYYFLVSSFFDCLLIQYGCRSLWSPASYGWYCTYCRFGLLPISLIAPSLSLWCHCTTHRALGNFEPVLSFSNWMSAILATKLILHASLNQVDLNLTLLLPSLLLWNKLHLLRLKNMPNKWFTILITLAKTGPVLGIKKNRDEPGLIITFLF
jgi:hypothetical protein